MTQFTKSWIKAHRFLKEARRKLWGIGKPYLSYSKGQIVKAGNKAIPFAKTQLNIAARQLIKQGLRLRRLVRRTDIKGQFAKSSLFYLLHKNIKPLTISTHYQLRRIVHLFKSGPRRLKNQYHFKAGAIDWRGHQQSFLKHSKRISMSFARQAKHFSLSLVSLSLGKFLRASAQKLQATPLWHFKTAPKPGHTLSIKQQAAAFQKIIKSFPGALALWDKNDKLTIANDNFFSLYNLDKQEMEDGIDYRRVALSSKALAINPKAGQDQYDVKMKDGRHMLVSHKEIKNDDNTPGKQTMLYVVDASRQLAQLEQSQAEIHALKEKLNILQLKNKQLEQQNKSSLLPPSFKNDKLKAEERAMASPELTQFINKGRGPVEKLLSLASQAVHLGKTSDQNTPLADNLNELSKSAQQLKQIFEKYAAPSNQEASIDETGLPPLKAVNLYHLIKQTTALFEGQLNKHIKLTGGKNIYTTMRKPLMAQALINLHLFLIEDVRHLNQIDFLINKKNGLVSLNITIEGDGFPDQIIIDSLDGDQTVSPPESWPPIFNQVNDWDIFRSLIKGLEGQITYNKSNKLTRIITLSFPRQKSSLNQIEPSANLAAPQGAALSA